MRRAVLLLAAAFLANVGLPGTVLSAELLQAIYGNSCAIDAIYLCLHSKNIEAPYQDIFEKCSAGRNEDNLVNLKTAVDVLGDYKIKCVAMRTNSEALRKLDGAVLMVTKGDDFGNHLIFAQISNGKILAFDPVRSASPISFTDDDLKNFWLGIVVHCQ